MNRVEYTLSRTLKLADFESVKIQVGLCLDFEGTKKGAEEAFANAKRFVDTKVAQQEHEWKVGEGGD